LPHATSTLALLATGLPTLQQLEAGSIIEGLSTPGGDHDRSCRCWYGPIRSGPGSHMLLAFADDATERHSLDEQTYLAQIRRTLDLAGSGSNLVVPA
jgi:hypothetical protein